MSHEAFVFLSCVFIVDKGVTHQYAAGGDDCDKWSSLDTTETRIDAECVKQRKSTEIRTQRSEANDRYIGEAQNRSKGCLFTVE